ncbi:MAG: hypothetical protein K8R60_04240 [Burkholderiales bacterium]|nr:hypothetical protein [Burkholderiales bacterium]
MHTPLLLKTVAVVEFATGVGLLALPSTVAELLAGGALGPGTPMLVGRVAGAALIAIGLACWMEAVGERPGAPTGLLVGLLAYNGAIPVLLLHSLAASGTNGLGLWPTVILHIAVCLWIAVELRSQRALRGRWTP